MSSAETPWLLSNLSPWSLVARKTEELAGAPCSGRLRPRRRQWRGGEAPGVSCELADPPTSAQDGPWRPGHGSRWRPPRWCPHGGASAADLDSEYEHRVHEMEAKPMVVLAGSEKAQNRENVDGVELGPPAMVAPLWSGHRARGRASRGWRGMRKALGCFSTSTTGRGGALGEQQRRRGRTRAWQPRPRHASSIEAFRRTGGGHRSIQGGTPIQASSRPNLDMGL